MISISIFFFLFSVGIFILCEIYNLLGWFELRGFELVWFGLVWCWLSFYVLLALIRAIVCITTHIESNRPQNDWVIELKFLTIFRSFFGFGFGFDFDFLSIKLNTTKGFYTREEKKAYAFNILSLQIEFHWFWSIQLSYCIVAQWTKL